MGQASDTHGGVGSPYFLIQITSQSEMGGKSHLWIPSTPPHGKGAVLAGAGQGNV